MGLSETIVAAMIGAIATVSTALFQIFTALRTRNNVHVKPRRGSAMRSILAVLALMVASAAGGFLYSELLRQRGGEEIRAMRQELRELHDLTAATVRERDNQHIPIKAAVDVPVITNVSEAALSQDPVSGSSESVAYVPACRRGALVNTAATNESVDCSESDAQQIALCGTIPAAARVEQIQLFAQPDALRQSWSQHAATVGQDVGGARFTGKTFEYAQSDDLKSVCVNFVHWSGEHPHIARILVRYRLGAESESASPVAADATPVMTQTLINADTTQAAPGAVSLVNSGASE
jgi:hypothetical protein